MLKRLISKDWYFSETGQNFVPIDLPHDYAVTGKRAADVPCGSSNGYYPNSSSVYVRHLRFDRKAHYLLDLDGAYMNTRVFLNENYVAFHPYGYTPFLVDLTPYILENCTNKLKITLDPFDNTCRWYSGNGIYRDVFLWEGGDIRIEPWDLFVSTVCCDEASARLRLRYTVTADRAEEVLVRFTVLSPAEEAVKTEEITCSVPAGKTDCEHLMTISAPQLWDLENPNLYTLKTEIFAGETLTDTAVNTFGIRTITADAVNGLRLNGKQLKLRGGCIHQDHGALGAAAFPAAEERKVRLLKELGFNAVRTAHNPPSLAFLEVCDRLGIVVMDEAFDTWNKPKNKNDYSLFFEDWWMRDISYMVKRDRSHPCVFSYSIGNEILEIDCTSNAPAWSAKLSAEIRKYDDTRFVTSGLQKSFARRGTPDAMDPDDYRAYLKTRFNDMTPRETNNAVLGYEEPLDIVGYNYYFMNYDLDREMYPDRVMWSSETQVRKFWESWRYVRDTNFVIGDFTWTAMDYMGEAGTNRGIWGRYGFVPRVRSGGFPWRCYQGDLDLCGYRSPMSYFREAIWLGNAPLRIFTTDPEHFHEGVSGSWHHWFDVEENWTFDDKYVGRPITVETYTDADEIVWFINGKEAGRTIPEQAIARMDTIYEKGEITAVAYRNGVECDRCTLTTVGEVRAVNIVPEKDEFLADNRDLCYLQVSVVDREGRLVTAGESKLRCLVEGGELLGFFSANPCSEDQYGSDTCHTYRGMALAVVRTKDAGKVNVHIYSDTLAPGHAEVIAK